MAEAAEALDVADAPDTGADPPEAANDPQSLLDGVASEMGWSPKDKWKGDPDKWRDSTAYLKATPQVLKSMKEQLERSARVASQTIERNQREAVADAERRIEAAAAAGNAEAVKQATQDLKEASRAPDPQVSDWAAKNPWYLTHKKATTLAIEAAQEVADTGGTVAAQLAAGEAEVQKRFPELFGDEPPEDKPSRAPPAVQGGQRSSTTAPRKRGWSDIPAAARAVMTPKILKSFNQSEAEYAEAYWAENG